MTSKPRALELFSRQGGTAMGLHQAGFEVTCVDIEPQPRCPFEFHQADAVEYVKEHGHKYHLIAGGPPCQRYSLTQRIQGNEHPDLIGEFRDAAISTGRPYLIENVEEARPELVNPIMLCGPAFGLRTYRHRLFESNVELTAPWPTDDQGREHDVLYHRWTTVKMGRPLRWGDFYHAVGNFSNVPYVRFDMGVEWMTREGIRECIPTYAWYLGRQLRDAI